MVRGAAPVIFDADSLTEDRSQREALVAALQESNLILGYTPSRSSTYER